MSFRHESFRESVSGEEENRNGERKTELTNVKAGNRKRQPGNSKRESRNVKAENRKQGRGDTKQGPWSLEKYGKLCGIMVFHAFPDSTVPALCPLFLVFCSLLSRFCFPVCCFLADASCSPLSRFSVLLYVSRSCFPPPPKLIHKMINDEKACFEKWYFWSRAIEKSMF